MKKHNLIITVSTCMFIFALGQLLTGNGNVYGFPLMGPPRSTLQEGQTAFGIEAGYSEMDLKSFGKVTETSAFLVVPDISEYKIEKLKSTMISARLDINVLENMDLFVRLGATDATDEITEVQAADKYKDFDGNFGFSWGVGTRATFYKDQEGITSWGGIFQINWVNPGTSTITNENDINFSGDAEISYWEAQLGVGPTVEFENIRVYGGPFLHFVTGDLDIKGSTTEPIPVGTTFKASHEIREQSQLGGFLGAQWKLGENSSLVTEGQFTGDGWGIGIGTTWKF